MSAKKSKTSFFKKVLIAIVFIIVLGGSIAAYEIYDSVYLPNVSLKKTEFTYLYIKTGSTIDGVIDQLYSRGIIINKNTFNWVAEKKNYANHVHPGKYLIKNHLNNNDLINLLRSGKQTPVKLSLNNCVRKKEYFISEICKALEVDSLKLDKLLNDDQFLAAYDLNSETAIALFIANTYEFYWNTSAEKFVTKMGEEYNKFWTQERIQKANEIGLKPAEVITLASIVQNETIRDTDRPIIAGVYINRLKKNMPLQADPTLVWASGDFSINRVLNVHKEIDSPYNTYLHTGLPPGPICMVDKKNIDAVLNYQKHNYLYFCAKEDFSGYSNFAENYEQHQLNARRYQKALNEKGIQH